ncbi:MAG TPA: class I SAM-dependent methyltransferase [Candidatus Saccharimonadales bacterium]|jgi:ubiquinone/menaquinone biosynthesis C-methylase UbiE|nr:class I SAM-dependent methyltransferase [Candidatus Saccharimonadales bacterium]
MHRRERPNYGIDAPNVVLTFLLIGVLGLGLSVWLRFLWIPASVFLLECLVMLWGSRVGKFRVRDKLLNSISWQGSEKVLDVGCGHGLMLIGAAKRLREGPAVGIDLWQKQDQAGNSREATLLNVRLENVADRVELVDGDARKLPFEENAFDVVVSSWALHNIYDRAGRDAAVREIARVLKPGGRLLIIDIRHTGEYAEVLRQNKMSEVHRTGPNFLFVIPSFALTARKPAVA